MASRLAPTLGYSHFVEPKSLVSMAFRVLLTHGPSVWPWDNGGQPNSRANDPATIGTTPTTMKAGKKHSAMGAAAITPTLRARCWACARARPRRSAASRVSAAARASQIAGFWRRRAPAGPAGVVPQEQPLIDRRRPEPNSGGHPVKTRTEGAAERSRDHLDGPVPRQTGLRTGRQEIDGKRQRAPDRLALAGRAG